MAKLQPTPEQLAALQRYARDNGRNWKRELCSAWFDGSDVTRNVDGPYLRQVRNTFGPQWLMKFKLPA